MKKSKKKRGRPAMDGVQEAHRATVRYPVALWRRITKRAAREKIEPSEWLRDAASEKLNRDE